MMQRFLLEAKASGPHPAARLQDCVVRLLVVVTVSGCVPVNSAGQERFCGLCAAERSLSVGGNSTLKQGLISSRRLQLC